MDQIFRALGFAALCASPCLMVYFLISIVRTRTFILRSVEVNGEVIRLERSKTRDRYGYSYAPVFSFTVTDGRSFTVTSDVSSSPPGFFEGEPVTVRYSPDDPEKARIHTVFQTWGSAIISGFAGVFCLFWGCVVLGLFHFGK
jgi:Protein of unknown function (DUF3592)